MHIARKWRDDLNTGIGLIDNQHRIIFDLINDLGNASEAKADKKVIDTLFDVIENYVFRHFEAEEALIAPHAGAKEHTLEHYTLIKEFKKMRLSFRNRLGADSSVHGFLEQWFVGHISESDLPMFTRIAQGGDLPTRNDVDDYLQEQQERRRHKRVQQKKITDHAIVASCYNTSSLHNSQATVLDVSLGGIRLQSEDTHQVGDLLVVQCALGRNFRMKEKVRIVNSNDDIFGAEFVGLSPATEKFLMELYGAVNIRNF